MEGHRDLVIGSNERSWFVDVPFDHFGQKHPTGSCKIDQSELISDPDLRIEPGSDFKAPTPKLGAYRVGVSVRLSSLSCTG